MIRALYSAAAVVTRTVCALDPSQPIPGLRDWEIIETPGHTPGRQPPGRSAVRITGHGVVWVALGSGHLASFDRRKCKGRLNGPDAIGQHCPDGWTLYPTPAELPEREGLWQRRLALLRLGRSIRYAGPGKEHADRDEEQFRFVLALVNSKFVVLRVPYPLGFFAKGMDGRIDDPKAGWKGKGVWTTWGTRTPFHAETGKGTMPRVVRFQMRPNPIAD
jgi:hypothetical protein